MELQALQYFILLQLLTCKEGNYYTINLQLGNKPQISHPVYNSMCMPCVCGWSCDMHYQVFWWWQFFQRIFLKCSFKTRTYESGCRLSLSLAPCASLSLPFPFTLSSHFFICMHLFLFCLFFAWILYQCIHL